MQCPASPSVQPLTVLINMFDFKKKIQKSDIFLFISIILIIIAVYILKHQHGGFDERYINLVSFKEVDSIILKKLKKQNIAHKVDEYGVIYYRSADKKIFNDIIVEAEREYDSQWHKISFFNREWEQHFISLLESENIPYKREEMIEGDPEFFVWHDKYNDKVEPLIKAVYKRFCVPYSIESE